MKKNYKSFPLFVAVLFFQNTGYKTGKPGMTEIFWAPATDITVQPEPPAAYGLVGETATATGAWTATNGFIKLNNELFTGSALKIKSDGNKISPSITTTIEGDVMGLDAELVERHRDMLGVPGILVIKDNTCPTDTYWVVGCGCSHAYASFDFDSDRVGGSNGKKWALVFEAKCAPYLWSQEANTLPLSTETGQ